MGFKRILGSPGYSQKQIDKKLLLGRRSSLPRPDQVDVVMASPPTVGTPATTSIITSGVLIPAVTHSGSTEVLLNSCFTYKGLGGFAQLGTTFPNYNYIKTTSLTTTTTTTSPGVVEFMFDGDVVELYLKGTGAKPRVRVDGQLVTAGATFTPTNNGSVYFCPLTFASRAIRRITVEMDTSTAWGGVQIGPTDAIWATEVRGPRVVVLGDSFTEGTGSATNTAWWGRKMSEMLGWSEVFQSGVGGTGYLNPGSGGRVKFRDRVTNDVTQWNPDIVVVAGGINDYLGYTTSQLQTEAEALYSAIKAACPKAILIVTSPFWKGGAETLTAALLDGRDAIKAAAINQGAYYVDVLEMPLRTNVLAAISTTMSASSSVSATTISVAAAIPKRSTIEIGTGSTRERRVVTGVSGSGPFTLTVKALANAHASGSVVNQVGNCHWTGSGAVGALQADGNSDVYVNTDGTHPTQAGHDALGAQVARLIAETVLPA